MYIYDIHNIPWKSLTMNLNHIFIKYLFICIPRLYNNDVIFPVADFLCIQKGIGRVRRDEHASRCYNLRVFPAMYVEVTYVRVIHSLIY